MDSITLRSRLLKLLQKSRKASRLYGSIDSSDSHDELKEKQAKEWKKVTSELLLELSSTLENPNPKRVLQQAFNMRDRFHSDYRMAESELNRSQRDLINVAEIGDFTRAFGLSASLISLKARVQACQAAYHELSEILARAKLPSDLVSHIVDESEVNNQFTYGKQAQLRSEVDSEDDLRSAKVIPLRQKRVVSAL
jgi:hypothetical protein